MPDQVDPTANRGYNKVSLSLGRIMANNFLGGLAWGFGTVIGATLLVGIAIWVLAQTGFLTQFAANLQTTFTDAFLKGVQSVPLPK